MFTSFLFDIFYGIYGLGMFGTFLHGNFSRQLAIARAKADPNEVDKTVHAALWDVRKTFVGLFSDDRARQNALNLFPSLRDLPETEDEIEPIHTISRTKVVFDSVLFPVMIPTNLSKKAANNIAAAELAAIKAQKESYEILAEHEEYPRLAEAFRSGDDSRIQAAIIEKTDWQDRMSELERNAPELALDVYVKAREAIDNGNQPVYDPDSKEYLGSVLNQPYETSILKSAMQ